MEDVKKCGLTDEFVRSKRIKMEMISNWQKIKSCILFLNFYPTINKEVNNEEW